MVIDTMLGPIEFEWEVTGVMPIGTIFDVELPWPVLDLGHGAFTLNTSNAVRDTRLDTMEVS